VCTVAGSPGTWTQIGGAAGITVLNYTEFTSNVSVVSSTEATPTVVVTASGSVSVDGSTLICVEFYSPVTSGNVGGQCILDLWSDAAGGTALGRMAHVLSGAAVTGGAPVYVRRYFTPANGTPTYSIRGWSSGGSGNPTVQAGAGGTSADMPGFIRVSKGA